MNPEYEKQLEAAVRRELDTLGELTAPPGLSARILGTIERRATAPWYQRAWPTWPTPWRIASAFVLLGALFGVWFGVWKFTETSAFASFAHTVGSVFDGLEFCRRTLSLLMNSLGLVFARLGPVFIAAAVMLFTAAYAACVGLGTLYVRLAFARRQP